MKLVAKIIAVLFIFILLIQGSIYVFNIYNPWLGIGIGCIVIISAFLYVIKLIEKSQNTFKKHSDK